MLAISLQINGKGDVLLQLCGTAKGEKVLVCQNIVF
jgi:hypothetical protein